MSAGNDLRDLQIEPVYYVPNQRAEFRLPEGRIFSTDIFLANLGVTKPLPLSGGAAYGNWAGVYGTITQMTLYDGNVVLSHISDVGRWAGFKMFNKSNDYNNSVGQYYSLGVQSTRMGETDVRSVQDFLSDKRGTNTTAPAVSHLRSTGEKLVPGKTRDFLSKPVDVGASGTSKGLLRARHIFDLLNKLPYIDTSIFKNFRVVCEMSADPLRVTKSFHNQALTTCRPLLIVTELIDDELKGGLLGKFTPVQFDEIEDDRVRIPRIEACYTAASVAAASVNSPGRNPAQVQNYHINGFNNKSLGRLLLWKAPIHDYNIGPVTGDGGSMQGMSGGAGGVAGNGIYASTGFLGEQNQVRLNGRNIFARSGIVGDNRRLAQMVDSWGNCAMAPFANGLAYTEIDGMDRSLYLKEEGNSVIGHQSFVGVDLAGERCSDMQIDFTRLGQFMTGSGVVTTPSTEANRTKYNQAHDLLLWCEVKKQLVPDPTQSQGYNVQYA